jgi:fumarate reductase subunit C
MKSKNELILSIQSSHSPLRSKLIFISFTNHIIIQVDLIKLTYMLQCAHFFNSVIPHTALQAIIGSNMNVSIFTYVLGGYFSRISGQNQSIQTWTSKLYQGKL